MLPCCHWDLQVSLPAWSAVGAAALLAGNTRLLLATALIVSETSGCTPVIGLVIIATALGKAVADAIIPVRPGDYRLPGWRLCPRLSLWCLCAQRCALARTMLCCLTPLPPAHRLSRRCMHGRRSRRGMPCWSPWTPPIRSSCSGPCEHRCGRGHLANAFQALLPAAGFQRHQEGCLQ